MKRLFVYLIFAVTLAGRAVYCCEPVPPATPPPCAILYAHYKWNETAANTTVTDSSDNVRHKVYASGTAASHTTTSAKVERASRFSVSGEDGTDRVFFGTTFFNDHITTGAEYCIAGWFRIDVSVTGKYLLAKDQNPRELLIYTSGNNIIIRQRCPILIFAKTLTNGASDGLWHHIILQRTSTQIEIWADGNLLGSSSAAGWDYSIESAANMQIMWSVQGVIDDLRFFTRALTTDEIVALYNSGAGTEDCFSEPQDEYPIFWGFGGMTGF